MAKDILMKYLNEQDEWEELFPQTKTTLVENEAGETIQTLLGAKANANEVYTSVEIDNMIGDIETELGDIDHFDIPVSTSEPTTDVKFWFEEI